MSRQVFMNLKAPLDYLRLKDIDADLVVISPDKGDHNMPCTSADQISPAKKQQKKDQKLLGKKNLVYSKWSNMDDTKLIKLENL